MTKFRRGLRYFIAWILVCTALLFLLPAIVHACEWEGDYVSLPRMP